VGHSHDGTPVMPAAALVTTSTAGTTGQGRSRIRRPTRKKVGSPTRRPTAASRRTSREPVSPVVARLQGALLPRGCRPAEPCVPGVFFPVLVHSVLRHARARSAMKKYGAMQAHLSGERFPRARRHLGVFILRPARAVKVSCLVRQHGRSAQTGRARPDPNYLGQEARLERDTASGRSRQRGALPGSLKTREIIACRPLSAPAAGRSRDCAGELELMLVKPQPACQRSRTLDIAPWPVGIHDDINASAGGLRYGLKRAPW